VTPLAVRIAPATWVPVETLAEASRAVREHLDSNALGASQWGQIHAPVKNEAGKVVAVISFNGRVWTPARDWRKQVEITGEALTRGGAR
jgi:hypothetical protein